jgi:C-terminal processing protease CtpA/Prc
MFVRPVAALLLVGLLIGAAPAPSPTPTMAPAAVFSVSDRAAVLAAAEKALGDYVFQNRVAAMRAVLVQNRAKYLALDTPDAFADAVTKDLYGVVHDKHVRLEYSDEILSPNTEKPSDVDMKQIIQMFASRNFGVIGTLRLRGNIGYMHLGNFGPMPQTKAAIDAAMTMVGHTDALVIDVRHNGGGDPDSLDYLMGYFYSRPTELTSIVTVQKGKSETTRQFTAAKVSGQRYLNKPLYVLTDDMTFSCAEQFAYDMKSLHRALLIGTTTGGGANPGNFVRLNDHFSIFVPYGYARNPYTKTNWEGVGVVPDIPTTAPAALLEGYRRALVAAPEHFPQVVPERKKAEADPATALQQSLPAYQ